ncbi:alpha/beta fold hydrolase [Jannaschia aquimarina]|uniref:Alpha/beta hydrolase family protein n=1 Tax=Jannaschia aquimarina TaxID=935700 RepID=A0A0D1EJH8_9RHOB|nr:alpha/beta hydrolase [Jannaschia aquimarina]KIT17744.1 hypothetical protein jaqu_04670 [Jannaschia aquimarina]SNS96467.1 Alpha/beta hydrolase of unknown function [Jannaschia aquimarina]
MALVLSSRAFASPARMSMRGSSGATHYGIVDRPSGIGAPKLRLVTQAKWLALIAAAAHDNRVLFYVHGYNTRPTGFLRHLLKVETALRRNGYHGAIVGYDWPSLGKPSPAAYRADRRTIHRIARHLVLDGLFPILGLSPRPRVSLAAHSMGGLMALNALGQFGTRASPWKWLDQVLFTAADVRIDQMASGGNGARLLALRAKRFTNYYNPWDEILSLSGPFLNGGSKRAGRAGLPASVPAGHHDIHCLDQFRRDAHGTAGSDFENMLLSHGWWWDNAGFVRDAALTLLGKSATAMPTRRPTTTTDQALWT